MSSQDDFTIAEAILRGLNNEVIFRRQENGDLYAKDGCYYFLDARDENSARQTYVYDSRKEKVLDPIVEESQLAWVPMETQWYPYQKNSQSAINLAETYNDPAMMLPEVRYSIREAWNGALIMESLCLQNDAGFQAGSASRKQEPPDPSSLPDWSDLPDPDQPTASLDDALGYPFAMAPTPAMGTSYGCSSTWAFGESMQREGVNLPPQTGLSYGGLAGDFFCSHGGFDGNAPVFLTSTPPPPIEDVSGALFVTAPTPAGGTPYGGSGTWSLDALMQAEGVHLPQGSATWPASDNAGFNVTNLSQISSFYAPPLEAQRPSNWDAAVRGQDGFLDSQCDVVNQPEEHGSFSNKLAGYSSDLPGSSHWLQINALHNEPASAISPQYVSPKGNLWSAGGSMNQGRSRGGRGGR